MGDEQRDAEASYAAHWQTKRAMFLAALEALCQEHGVVIEGQMRVLPAWLLKSAEAKT